MLGISILVVFGPLVFVHILIIKDMVKKYDNQEIDWHHGFYIIGLIWVPIILAFFGIGQIECYGDRYVC